MEEMDLIKILQCPNCGGSINKSLHCVSCKHIYRKEDDIYGLMSDFKWPMPSVYSDINYLQYHKISSETNEYFYHNRNPLINWVSGSGYRQIRKILKEKAGFILECGCGAGAFLDFNQNINLKNYVMLDIDREALKLVKEREYIRGVVHGSSYKLPFADDSFDTIISHAQLEHLLFLDTALDEIKRVLKPEGKFIASIPTEGGFLWATGRCFTTARYFRRKLGIDYIKANRIDHCNTINQVERSIKRYFVVKKRILFPFFIPSFHFNLTSTYILAPLNK